MEIGEQDFQLSLHAAAVILNTFLSQNVKDHVYVRHLLFVKF